MKTTAAQPTPPTARSEQSSTGRSAFVSLALDMSWKLTFAVLVPIIAGVYVDRPADTEHVFTFIGLAIAVVASIGVMWRVLQTANSLPVPKLSAAEKRRIQKEYEAEDEDV